MAAVAKPCGICGSDSAISIQLKIYRRGMKGQAGSYRSAATNAVGLCARHAIPLTRIDEVSTESALVDLLRQARAEVGL